MVSEVNTAVNRPRMKRKLTASILIVLLLCAAFVLPACKKKDEGNPKVTVIMEDGSEIHLELFPEFAPETVANFLKLVDEHFYDGVVIHRNIKDFMIQTGWVTYDDTSETFSFKPEVPSIKGEFASNGFTQNTLSHTTGVISMARTDNMDSASGQFFICTSNGTNVKALDGNYAAFGQVTDVQSKNVLAMLASYGAAGYTMYGVLDTGSTVTFTDFPTLNYVPEYLRIKTVIRE
jgi:cyclophilin family peptidyl-prolyl cis-trans isomerase